MSTIQSTLRSVISHSPPVKPGNIRKILMLYEEQIPMLGDCCKRFDKFKYLSLYFNNPFLQINFTNPATKYHEGLLKHNPYIHCISEQRWDDLDLASFDAVLCVMYDEEKFLGFLDRKYGAQIAGGSFPLAVYSMSEVILTSNPAGKYVFPVLEGLREYLHRLQPGELYLSTAEREWGDQWLEAKGVEANEDLFILLDSTLVPGKLLRMSVFLKILAGMLEKPNAKVLLFDEKNDGKEAVYRRCLGSRCGDRMIFATGLSLRQVLCLIGSRYTRLVLGPCTGLMHCTSSIYNNYVSNGMDPGDVPLIITYTGKYNETNYRVDVWWNDSPLVDCLLLKQTGNGKEIVLLKDLTEAEKISNHSLACTEYTEQLLNHFINERIQERSGRKAARRHAQPA
ncbi:MAG TPA: hypothetical protein VF646_04780 [Cytophagales bacterium]